MQMQEFFQIERQCDVRNLFFSSSYIHILYKGIGRFNQYAIRPERNGEDRIVKENRKKC